LGFGGTGLRSATQPRQFRPCQVSSHLLGGGGLRLAIRLGFQQS
jgi:hypothetical protein